MSNATKECVQSVLRENPHMSESDAYAICNANADNTTPVDDSLFSAAEMDVLAAEFDQVINRAEHAGAIHWFTDDHEIHYRHVGDLDGGIGSKSTMAGPVSAVQGGEGAAPLPNIPDTNKLDTEALSEEQVDAIEADDFIIYGKASIEQYDEDDVPTLINMDALEDALDRYFQSETAPGIISRFHMDLPVGVPLETHTLNDEATVQLPNGETHHYDAGEKIESEVREGADGRPELWLVSNIDNGSELGKRTRLQILSGELDGYSVTIRRNDYEMTSEGREVTECDLHATTIGTEHEIKNKGSTFDVAEFKANLMQRAQDIGLQTPSTT